MIPAFELLGRITELLKTENPLKNPLNSSENKMKNLNNNNNINNNLNGEKTTKKKCLILSIDGGGLRGIITTLVLERLVAKFPTLLSHVTVLAGTR